MIENKNINNENIENGNINNENIENESIENGNIENGNMTDCHPSMCGNCSLECSMAQVLNTDGDKEFVVVKFKGQRTDVFINYKNIKLFNGDYAIVTSEIGFDAGQIIHTFKSSEESAEKKYNRKINKTIVRKGYQKDIEKLYLNREEEKIIIEKIGIISLSYGLDIKLIDVEWQFDKHKLGIFFTAPQRVDFRELVKDLARQFKTRIELRQISPRDEIAKFGNSIGTCGRTICCNTFLNDYGKVGLEHSKIQQLSHSALKLNGNCMKLKCCVGFEYDFYKKELESYPSIHSTIIKSKVEYKLNKIDVLKEEVTLYNTNEKMLQVMNKLDFNKLLKGAKVIQNQPETTEDVIVEEDIIIE
jgi:cell fate regulator YaaT (PSP1 superfamily)